jgi:hypothetical protein
MKIDDLAKNNYVYLKFSSIFVQLRIPQVVTMDVVGPGIFDAVSGSGKHSNAPSVRNAFG